MIRSFSARLRRIRDDESGLSLAEVLVSGLLTVAIMAMIGTMFVSTAKLTTQSTQTSKSNNVASNIANEVTSVLRVATTLPVSGQIVNSPAIVSGTRESVTLYAFSNTDPTTPAPVRIKFTISSAPDRNVIEERCTATLSGGFYAFGPVTSCTGTLTTRNLGGAVQAVTGTTDQFLTYYTAVGTEIAIGAGALTDAQRATVASIRVYVSIKANGSTNKPAVISNTVVMGNLGLDNVES